MVLERSLPLLQQEEEEFRADKGIHEGNTTETKTQKKRKQKRRVDTEVTVLVGPSVTLYQGTRSKETRSSHKRKSLISKL